MSRSTARITAPRVLLAAGAALLLAYAAGCDTLGEPETLSRSYEKSFRFEFSGSQLQAGQAVQIESENQVDLSADLAADGFTTGEVVSAFVTAAELERIQPLSVNLSFLSSASLELLGGTSALGVATQSGFPAATRADLSAQSGVDVASLVRRPTFRARLRLTPAQVAAGEEYRLEVTVRFRVEVEGV